MSNNQQSSTVFAIYEVLPLPNILGSSVQRHLHTCTTEESCLQFLQQLDDRKAHYEVKEVSFSGSYTRVDARTQRNFIKMRDALRHPEKIDTSIDDALLGIELQAMFKETFGE